LVSDDKGGSGRPPSPRAAAASARASREVVDAFAHRGEYFRVLQETALSQTAVMTIGPGEDAGPEEQHTGDQIIYVVEGEAIVRIADGEHHARPGTLVTIPARTRHHVTNPGRVPLFFITVYAPPAY
jgi:mannose-6-phosphate isomerase-like protein (cupin superfamily)